MAGELEFGALHRDDRLLDALAARRDVPADDPVALLLAALADDVDTQPVPIGDAWAEGLFSRPLAAMQAESTRTEAAAGATTAASAVATAQLLAASDTLTAEPDVEPAPAVLTPGQRRRRRLLLPRAAATAGVAAVVIGAGGVAAAVGGGVSPIEGIRKVVSSVTEQVAPNRSPADKVSQLLNEAAAALGSHDAEKAGVLLDKAKTQLGRVDAALAGPLQADLTRLRAQVDSALRRVAGVLPVTAPVGAGAGRATQPAKAKPAQGQPQSTTRPVPSGTSISPVGSVPLGESPEDATESPAHARSDGITHGLPGPDIGNPADALPGSQKIPGESKIEETENDVQDKAGTIPKMGPDEVNTPVGPVQPWRSPSSIDVLDDPTVRQVTVDVAPAAGGAANGVSGGRP